MIGGLLVALLSGVLGTCTRSEAAEPAVLGDSARLLNPKISVIGFFLGAAGNGNREPRPLNLKEAEFAFQAAVDPYAKADVFLTAEPERAALEEAYLTWTALPWGLGARAGRMRLNFGKFNRIHAPETPFADRPLAAETFFGAEGLSEAGGELSWLISNPWDLYINFDFAAASPPAADEVPIFDRARSRNLLYTGRLGSYADLTEKANVTFGVSAARGPNNSTFDPVANSSNSLETNLLGVDIAFRWKDPARAVYRGLLWQTEWIGANRQLALAEDASKSREVRPWGLFSYLDWQFARRWHTGARYDYTRLANNVGRRAGGLLFLSFDPSEFSRLSLQGKYVANEFAKREFAAFLKITFNLGPHGAHPW